jgi:hypothetical protein
MPIDFVMTPEQLRLRAEARVFARDVLSKVGPATKDLSTPLARFTGLSRTSGSPERTEQYQTVCSLK